VISKETTTISKQIELCKEKHGKHQPRLNPPADTSNNGPIKFNEIAINICQTSNFHVILNKVNTFFKIISLSGNGKKRLGIE
jgi:hypothetical protein